MRQTLLEIVQGIMNEMESDEVNSITDTTESYSVAKIIRQCFYDCAVELNLPEHHKLFELNASGESIKPCVMFVPDNVKRVEWIQYDVKDGTETQSNMKLLDFVPLDEFILRTKSAANDPSGITGEQGVVSNGESFNFTYKNNRFPSFYTSFDDRTIVFDSYDNTIENTLQKSKTMCYGSTYPFFSLTDDYYPEIDATQYSYLISKAKTRAFYTMKQQTNEESASEARKQKIVLQKRKRRVRTEDEVYLAPRYGRR